MPVIDVERPQDRAPSARNEEARVAPSAALARARGPAWAAGCAARAERAGFVRHSGHSALTPVLHCLDAVLVELVSAAERSGRPRSLAAWVSRSCVRKIGQHSTTLAIVVHECALLGRASSPRVLPEIAYDLLVERGKRTVRGAFESKYKTARSASCPSPRWREGRRDRAAAQRPRAA